MGNGGGLLEEEGLFLPEDKEGELDLRRSPGSTSTLVVGTALAACCALMVVGAGNALTWTAGGAAMLLFVVFAWTASRGIEMQNREVDELLGE